MVRLAGAVLAGSLMLLPALAGGQEAANPPAVDSTGPTLAAPENVVDAAPVLPGVVETATSSEVQEVEADLPTLVLKAHPVVQAVMALLALSVAAVLTVFLFKAVEFTLAFGRLRRSLAAMSKVSDLPALTTRCPLAEALHAARTEEAALPAPLTADLRGSARERLDMALERVEAGVVQRLRSGTGLLASIGAVAPFVGLFGTVFGIMNSFLAIATTKTTNLAVVAPGIAEALLATGIGLVAAIPAVLLYNRCMRKIAAFRHHLADGTAEVRRRFSLALDARLAGGA